jgi:23S rRNA (pseudouridine1915-N3)-methyltransferase
MKLSIIAVGKIKKAYWAHAQDDYLKRLRYYAAVQIIEVKDRMGQGLEEKKAMIKEGEDILLAAEDAPAIIALTPTGKLLDSAAWAVSLRKMAETYQRLVFVIGGPGGLSPDVLRKSRLPLALSPMTFPHEMARIVFLEQLYRAFTILGGEKYHR